MQEEPETSDPNHDPFRSPSKTIRVINEGCSISGCGCIISIFVVIFVAVLLAAATIVRVVMVV